VPKWKLVDTLLRVDIRLLGPVEVAVGGLVRDGGPPQQRVVLAALAMDAGRIVPLPVLVDRVWGESPPSSARQALYTHIAHIRHLLAADGDVTVVRRSGGYLLRLDPQRVDVHRFLGLVARARDVRCPDPERVALLRQALDLWQQEPLAGLPGAWAEQMRTRWRRQRLEAVVSWADAELRQGHGVALIGPLGEMAAEHPLAEPLIAALLRALHAAGHTAEALDWYEATRKRLADELGTDPGPELRALHRTILRGEPTGPGSAAPSVVPAQLPPDVSGFAGRAELLARLDAVRGSTGQPTAVVIGAVSGTAGVGKTALAVHWAHRIRAEYGDGQLYVNLRGFDPNGSPVPVAEAVRGFLDALGVAGPRVPSSVDAQIGLYRSLLADRRMLVVLDNARDAEQVRPLLPAASGCLALVTSRNQLTSLVTVEGARPFTVDLLTVDEARDLLTRRLGRSRVAAEPEAVDEIVERCARLPLALAIVATRAAAHPRFALGVLADELRRTRGGLDAFDGGELAADLRTVFSWSYRRLSDAAARMFRLLGLHPGPDIAVPAAASLAGLPASQVRRLLDELARAHLVEEHTPGRYGRHDLLRAYATELVAADADRAAAVHRLLDHYLHTAHDADNLLEPSLDPITPGLPRAGVSPERHADPASAWAWFVAERQALLGLVDLAAANGFDVHVWQLAATAAQFLDKHGYWEDWLGSQSAALAAARRLADARAQARVHRILLYASGQLGRHEEAFAHFEQADRLYRQIGDLRGQAHSHVNIGIILEHEGNHAQALDHVEQAHRLFEASGNRAGQGYTLNNIGWCRAQLGDYAAAVSYCEKALDVLREVGDRHGQAAALDSLGYVHGHLGHHHEAVTSYRRAIELLRDVGDRYNEADTLTNLGDTHASAGETGAARDAWLRALSILDNLDHPDADEVRARLAQDGRSASPG